MLFESAPQPLVHRRICVEASSPRVVRGVRRTSALHHLALSLPCCGVINLPLSAGGRNTDLSFLKEGLPSNVSAAAGGAWQGAEEVLVRVEGRGQGETAGNDNVCKAISPWQGPPYPGGALGATRLQPQCSVPLMSLMTPQTSQCGKHSRTVSLYLAWALGMVNKFTLYF